MFDSFRRRKESRKHESQASDFLIHRYDILMAAISRMQDARSVVLAGALALIGTVVVTGSVNVLTSENQAYKTLIVALLVAFGSLIVVVSALLTGYYSRGINRHATEVREFIEPQFEKMGFEARVDAQRRLVSTKVPRTRGGASTTFALVYSSLTAFLATLLIAGGDWHQGWEMAISVPVTLVAGLLSADIGLRLLPYWVSPSEPPINAAPSAISASRK